MFEKIFNVLKNFVLNNYLYIIGVCMTILFIIIVYLIVRKIGLKNILTLVQLIPSFIEAAESVYPEGFGNEKKLIVHHMVEQVASDLKCTKYLKYIDIDLIIEDVLSAPQKKGVLNDAKENEAQ